MASWPILLRVLANIVNVRSIYGLPYDHCWLPLWHCLRASHAWAIWPPCASCVFLLWLLYTDLRAAVLFHKPRPQQYHYDTSTNCTSLHLSGYSLPARPAVVWHRCHEGGRWWVRMSTRWGGHTGCTAFNGAGLGRVQSSGAGGTPNSPLHRWRARWHAHSPTENSRQDLSGAGGR